MLERAAECYRILLGYNNHDSEAFIVRLNSFRVLTTFLISKRREGEQFTFAFVFGKSFQVD